MVIREFARIWGGVKGPINEMKGARKVTKGAAHSNFRGPVVDMELARDTTADNCINGEVANSDADAHLFGNHAKLPEHREHCLDVIRMRIEIKVMC